MADVKRRYVTASIINAERIVFNIKGNDYRLVVAVDFQKAIVWIKWIGTHKAYDKIDLPVATGERRARIRLRWVAEGPSRGGPLRHTRRL